MKITNASKNTILALRAQRADSFIKRLIGLLGSSGLGEGEGLVLIPSNSIHSFFMRFTFDCIFLDSADTVIAVLPSFKPFRLSPLYLSACATLELPEGVIKASNTVPGDKIVFA